MLRIVLIGQGNVATSLHAAFSRKGMNVGMYSSRTGLSDLPQDADVYIYAVRDQALAEVVAQVHVQTRALHLHTSGSMPLSVFGPDKPHAGVLYPFRSFRKEAPIDDFGQVPVFIEARDVDDVAAVYTLALSLTPYVYETKQSDRERLHVAGVFANNFSNLMYGIAADVLRGTSIPFSALLPLIDHTAAAVHGLSPAAAQTGPAVRGDEAVMAKHMELLTDPQLREVYQMLSALIRRRS